MSAPLTIAAIADSTDLSPLLSQFLDAQRYTLHYFTSQSAALAQIAAFKHEIDCLIFDSRQNLLTTVTAIEDRRLVLPVVTIVAAVGDNHDYIYQPSEVMLVETDLATIGVAIDQAIAKFLTIAPPEPIVSNDRMAIAKPSFLLQQQRRLADKLKERLGYLAIYYKRNTRQFLRNLDSEQQQDLLAQLKVRYREIVLDYFTKSDRIDNQIDELVDIAFFSDISVSEIVKIHMELIEEFSNQLKLEGRSEEVLLDYRLTLIDTIAHLCEMYRRSIPREL